jgi:hypothetical protein
MKAKLRKDMHTANKGKESLRGSSVELPLTSRKEMVGFVMSRQGKGQGWGGENPTHREGAEWG